MFLFRIQFAFILEKTNNNGFSSFSASDKKEDYCSMIRQKNYQQKYEAMKETTTTTTTKQDYSLLFRTNFEKFMRRDVHTYSLIVFHLDLVKKKVDLIRIGKDLKNLHVTPTLNGKFGYGLKSESITKKSDRGMHLFIGHMRISSESLGLSEYNVLTLKQNCPFTIFFIKNINNWV